MFWNHQSNVKVIPSHAIKDFPCGLSNSFKAALHSDLIFDLRVMCKRSTIVLSLIILSKFEWISHFLAWNLDFPPNYWVGKWDLRGIFPHEAKPSVEISPESPIFQRNNGGKSRLKAGIGKELKFWQNNQGDCFFWFLPFFRNPVPKDIVKGPSKSFKK